MPELPEVETMARDLAPLLTDATITEAWWDWDSVISHPDPESFGGLVVGLQILGVRRRAKWLVFDLSHDRAMTITVRMTGQLFVLPKGTTHDKHVHLRFTLDGGPVAGGGRVDGPRWLLFRDVRKFGRVGLYRRDVDGTILGEDDEGELFGEHGPEPLSDDFTVRVFRERLRRRRGRLKTTLLDQSFIAGVGNIYADESLWRSRLHPLRSAGSLNTDQERRLYEAIRGVMSEAIERRGSSVDDYTAPEGDGEMQEHLDAYQRTGQPCHRCDRPIKRFELNARGTHFCSWCQRLPAADSTPSSLALVRSSRRAARRGRSWSELGGPESAR